LSGKLNGFSSSPKVSDVGALRNSKSGICSNEWEYIYVACTINNSVVKITIYSNCINEIKTY